MNEKCPKRKTPPSIPSKETARGNSSKRTEPAVNQSSSRRDSLPTNHEFSNVTKRECVTNLLNHVKCFCGKQASLIGSKFTLLCFYCNKNYHSDCMKRASSNKMCSLCHLKRLTLHRETKKVLFVGLLDKEKN